MTPEELDRLVKMTPEAVVEAAADTAKAEVDAALEGEVDRELVATILRLALPLLLAPEVAKREAAERERDEARSLLASTQQSLAMVAASSGTLEAALKRIADALPDYWAGGIARAALSGRDTV